MDWAHFGDCPCDEVPQFRVASGANVWSQMSANGMFMVNGDKIIEMADYVLS